MSLGSMFLVLGYLYPLYPFDVMCVPPLRHLASSMCGIHITYRGVRISCGVRTTSCRGAHITCRDKTSLTVSRLSLAVTLTTSCCQLPIIRFRKRLMIDSYYFDLINISNPLMKYFPFSYHSHLVAIPSPSLHSPRYNIISNFRNRITFFFSRKYNPT